MKLHQHAFAPLWPHFGTPICLHPVQRVYPYKAIQAELKGLYKQAEGILAGLRRIRQASDFETEAEVWQQFCFLLKNVLCDMPQLLGTPTLSNLLRLITEMRDTIEGIPQEVERLETANYFGYAPAMLDVQEIVGFPHAALEDFLPSDICPPELPLRIERAEFEALGRLSMLRQREPLIRGGCGLTPQTAIFLPKELPNYVSLEHKLFAAMFRVKASAQSLVTIETRQYDVLRSETPHRCPHALWFDITEHRKQELAVDL